MQLTSLLDLLPVDLHLVGVHDHAESAAEADRQQERDLLIDYMDGENAACSLESYWNFS